MDVGGNFKKRSPESPRRPPRPRRVSARPLNGSAKRHAHGQRREDGAGRVGAVQPAAGVLAAVFAEVAVLRNGNLDIAAGRC